MDPIDDRGYKRVRLRYNNDVDSSAIHRLVADAFIPKTEEDKLLGRDEVNHKNGIKNDNRVENLEWVTHTEKSDSRSEYGIKRLSLDS